ncbi:hypothetical protein Dimus_023165 [Dionaea muscipula]
MEGNRKDFLKRRPSEQFRKKGQSKRVKGNNAISDHDKRFGDPSDTVYRILCPMRKIGGVIGKAGGIINSLREETKAKISVADLVSGSEERVIMICSSPTKSSKTEKGDENEDETMQPHCAAQDALMRVHSRIIEEDFFGGVRDEEEDDSEVTARLLVPSNMVGCILGKGGEVIQRLRSEIGASIRVLPRDQVPTCAMSIDELVQISGKPSLVNRALYEVSTRLHQNPRKDKVSNVSMPFSGQDFHPRAPPLANRAPPGNPIWSRQNLPSHIPPDPWMEGFRNPSPRFVPDGYHDSPIRHGGEPSGEFSVKLLCLEEKIGGVIGKGGMNVKQLQQVTGASIHVEDASTETEERVIHVSAFETLLHPRSQTIDAILQLQPKASEFSDKGIITTRILVPSSKIGCIIGQGGSIINEMRWRTKADIRVHSKDDRPKCASEDEELVQVSGSFAVAKDALAEIASRLRTRSLRNANAVAEPILEKPVLGYGPPVSFPSRGISLSDSLEVGSSGYNAFKGGAHISEPSYPVQPNASGYQNVSGSVENNYTNNAVAPSYGAGGSMIKTSTETAGTRLKLQNPQDRGHDVVVDIRGTADHLNAVQNISNTFMASGPQSIYQQGTYPDPSSQLSSYPGMNPHQDPYQHAYAHESSYQNTYHVQQSGHQYSDSQHNVYQNVPVQGSYQY